MKKRALTLLEMMIVIFLIGTILSVIAYNMKGSLDKGRAFRTEQAITQIRDILELEAANGNTPRANDLDSIVEILRDSGLVKNPDKLIEDGWGQKLEIDIDDPNGVLIESKKLTAYRDRNAAKNI